MISCDRPVKTNNDTVYKFHVAVKRENFETFDTLDPFYSRYNPELHITDRHSVLRYFDVNGQKVEVMNHVDMFHVYKVDTVK